MTRRPKPTRIEHVEIVRRMPPRPSAYRSRTFNDLEMVAGHAVALHVRGNVRSVDIATALAAYRERIIERVERGGALDDIVADIRAGALK